MCWPLFGLTLAELVMALDDWQYNISIVYHAMKQQYKKDQMLVAPNLVHTFCKFILVVLHVI